MEVTYAVVPFHLHVNENFLRTYSLYVTTLLIRFVPTPAPQFWSDMTWVCLLSNRAALSLFICLSATHTNLECSFGKPKCTLSMQTDAVACERGRI